jgi:DNA-binding MarR family transcriptional regulator
LLEQSLPKQEPVGRLIALARRRLRQAVGRRVARFGLTPQQFWILVNLAEADEPSLVALCDRLRMDPPTASRIVASLARRGMVRAAPDPRDRRRIRLTLTARGSGLTGRLLPLAAEVRAATARDLSGAEADELRRLLHKVIASLERYDAGAAGEP